MPLYASKASDGLTLIDTSTTLESDKLSKFQWLDLRYNIPVGDLADNSGLEKVFNKLVEIRDLINDIELFPKPSQALEAELEIESEAESESTS